MDRIGSYSTYVQNYNTAREDSSIQREKTVAVKETTETKNNEKKVSLSEDAKNLLKELQKKYGNMDFIVADYETEEEAASYLARGTKEYSVLIEPDVLEQMAADEDVKTQYEGLIEDATAQLNDMKAQLGADGKEVKHLGISIGEDGKTTLFADLEQVSEKQRERIEKFREEKKEETKESKEAVKSESHAGEKVKKTRVSANSVEELLEKIRSVDWDAIKAESAAAVAAAVGGSRIDYTV